MPDTTLTPEAALEAELKALGLTLPPTGDPLAPGPPTPPPGPTTEDFNRLKAEFDAYKAGLEQRPEPRQAPAPPTPPASAPQVPSLQPRDYTVTDFATEANADPGTAIFNAMGAKMGLPKGMNPMMLLQPLAQQLAAQKAEIDTLRASHENSRKLQEEREFLAAVPEYEPNKENYTILEQYREQYGQPATAAGFKAAYALAQMEGAIQPKKARGQANDDTTQLPPTQDRSKARVPSVGQGTQATSPDMANLIGHMEQLDDAQAAAYMQRIARTLGQ